MILTPDPLRSASMMLQIILQTQTQSSLPADQRFTGLWDALRRIPQREGGWLVSSSS